MRPHTPSHGGYPGAIQVPDSLLDCWTIIPRHEAAEMEQAALLAHRGYAEAAESCRRFAGYGGLR